MRTHSSKRRTRPPRRGTDDLSPDYAIFALILLTLLEDDHDGSKRKRYIREAERALARAEQAAARRQPATAKPTPRPEKR
jgi:hypothetical protein